MQIDDYNQASTLTRKLQNSLPVQAYPGKQYLKMMRDRGEALSPDTVLTIEKVDYSGDMGGIVCVLAADPGQKQVYAVSLTHLKIDPAHPLAAEVTAYQQRRIRGLKLQNRKSVMSELRHLGRSTEPKKKRGKGGFGK